MGNNLGNQCFREILLAPMIVAGLLGRVDVKATSTGSGGITALPRAVRHGTALGIAALYPKTMEPLRLAGLLTSDPRKKERSKVNQPGARAKWIWYVFLFIYWDVSVFFSL
ncbi:30S ribosomal protein S9 family protein [Ancylostoma caninum]|uniref:30S ribosomal protein S9 family protein n=1 Tax=Ancylostoma caninum TaxID=29170 RepID=A0A368H070_ANCCA|nr:30S ribosomal protein S9 family protein [Ancylostoma caninum]